MSKKQEPPVRPSHQAAFIRKISLTLASVVDGSLPMPDARALIVKEWKQIDEDKRAEIAQGVLDELQKMKNVADGLYQEMQQATLPDRP